MPWGFTAARICGRRNWSFCSGASANPGNITGTSRAGLTTGRCSQDRIRKSVGAENTYSTDLMALSDCHQALAPLAEKVWRHVSKGDLHGRTVTLKVKYADFQQVTRARTLRHSVASEQELLEVACELSQLVLPDPRGARLLGITLSGFDLEPPPDSAQLDLFD